MRESAVPGPPGRALIEEHWSLERYFGTCLMAILAGYALLGKGFAYLHIPAAMPVYVGEIVLSIGILAAFLRPAVLPRSLASGPARLLVAFIVLGVVRTLPYLGTYGADAIRDAAVYYYGVFALLVFEIVKDRRMLERIAGCYGWFAGSYVFVAPAAAALTSLAPAFIPRSPGTDLPMVNIKGGDISVHLVGCVAFALLLADHVPGRRTGNRSTPWYMAAITSGLFVAGRGRAALLSLVCGLATASFLARDTVRRWKPVLAAGILLAAFLVLDPTVTLPSGRPMSVDIVAGEVESIFASGGDPEFRYNTKRWRLNWWSAVVDETLAGPYFLTGRGFGENLADAHGFQVHPGSARPLRSPHSSHMTVLARTGVPGFLLWVLLLGAIGWRFYTSWLRARDVGDTFLQGILAWVLCYWVAFVVNSSFDVYLEGPMGGIWFWSVVGLGLAAADRLATGHAATDVGRHG